MAGTLLHNPLYTPLQLSGRLAFKGTVHKVGNKFFPPQQLPQRQSVFHAQSARRLSASPTAMASQQQSVAPPPPEFAVPGLRETVWDQQNLKPRYPKLEANASCDVVVVGGGVAGLSVAYNLLQEGKSVMVLEARVIGGGQSGRTTAHLMPWNDDYYHLLEKYFGEKSTYLVGESHRESINWIENVIKKEGIDCEFRRLDGYLFADDESFSTLQKLRTEFEAAKKAGFLDVEWVEMGGKDPSMGSINSAIRWPWAAEFHPLMYLKGLAEAIEKKGGRIHEMTTVVSNPNNNNKVQTVEGLTVHAKAVVLATNSPIHHNLLVHARQSPYRSYVVGLKLPKGSVKLCDWWDTNTPYHYVRVEEKDDYDVLVVGGEDHHVGMKPKEYEDKWTKLATWARKRWSTAGDVLYRWSGMVFEPSDFLGLYGRNPGDLSDGNTYIATGDSGEGWTGGTIGGIVISSLICGKTHPWAELYSPSRALPVGLSTLQSEAQEVGATVQGYADALPFMGADSVAIEDLGKYCGAVIQDGLSKVAVFKDEKGIVHRYSAVCPHLKCIVKWNPNDSTFDCPCHGSLFDTTGRVINGPAKANLTPMS